jgi:hypothetical protein
MANFFHTPKAKKFSYRPWFYNEREEKRKERFARIDKELRQEQEARVAGRESYSYIKFARKERKKSNLRIFMILIALLLLVFFLMK